MKSFFEARGSTFIAVLLGCLFLSVLHFLALSPHPFAGSEGHHKILAPREIPERFLAIPRIRHGDPRYAGASDVAGYIKDAEQAADTGEVPRGLRHPLLTYLTAWIFNVCGHTVWVYYLIPFSAYAGSLWLVGRLAAGLFGPAAAAPAVVLVGLHPTIMHASFSYNSHAVAPVLALAVLTVFMRLLETGRGWLWVPLMALLGLARLMRLEYMALVVVFPAVAFALRRLFPGEARVSFGRWFVAGLLSWLVVTMPYHLLMWHQFGNPLHPFELGRLMKGQVDDVSPKYAGHEGPFKMFALFFLTGSWAWPFLFWRGARHVWRGPRACRFWAVAALLTVWFAGFSVQAVTDPGGLHVVFGMMLVAAVAAGGWVALPPPARILWSIHWPLYALSAQIIYIHFCQFLYGEGHLVLWAFGMEKVKDWITSLPFWKFGNP